MTLTDAQRTRLKIQDQPLIADVTRYGDGTARVFSLPHRNITSGSAFVPVGATAWSATGAAFDASGVVTLSGIVATNSAFRLTYVHSTFSDDEINDFLSIGGGVVGASVEAIEALMFDGVKRATWRAPDGSEYDDTQAMVHLREMHRLMTAARSEEATSAGDVLSWSMEQGNY